ncbi:hypothetical protein AYO22_00359 [Fonsecaea multimorphosa]|nr:hypothetical protein AYO22_00359 [Fonsecaea multimorphosa]
MSISCIITTADLAPLDTEGFHAVIFHTPAQLSRMSEWCVKTHGESGLVQECLTSSTSAADAAGQLLAYIKHYVPEPGRALLAGNSIHADRAFLAVPPWNAILEHLHYRLFDVSAMKEMVRRWASESVLMAAPRKELRHTARADVLESIQEAQYYKSLIEGMGLGNGIPVSPPSMPPIQPQPQQPFMPAPGTKQGQEALDMLRNSGSLIGDVGDLDPGFRTDIP